MQIDSLPRYNIPSPSDMDFDSDGIAPEFPSSFMPPNHTNSNNNSTFGSKFNSNNNYSPIITNEEEEEAETETLPQQMNLELIQWSTMSFTYVRNGDKRDGKIHLPVNLNHTPMSYSQPFQIESNEEPFGWSAVNEQLMSKLFKLDSFFSDKVVLELGSGFAIPSIISLYLGAKHVYITDGNEELTHILPVLMSKNNILRSKYTVKKLIYNNCSDLRWILRDIKNGNKAKNGVDILLASDVLDTKENALNFYETVCFYFDNYLVCAKQRFIRLKEKEYSISCNIPSIRSQFTSIAAQDINRPITSGGYLPYLLKPLFIDRSMTDTHSNTMSILSHSDDDISTNSNVNCLLPNTMHLPSISDEYQYRRPYGESGVCSLSAIETIANVESLVISRFDAAIYNAFNHNKESTKSSLPKFNHNKLNDDEDDADEDGDEQIIDQDKLNKKMRQFDEYEVERYLSKSAVNAPILILAINKRDRTHCDTKLKDDPFNTFYEKIISKGYRMQNVLFEWAFEVWIIKA